MDDMIGEMASRIESLDYADDSTLIDKAEKMVFGDSRLSGLSMLEKGKLVERVLGVVRGYGVLQKFLEDDEVSEIMVNGTEGVIIEKKEGMIRTGVRFPDRESLNNLIQRMASSVNRTVNKTSPILDLRLINGSRVNIVLDPVSVEGPTITIRKFLKNIITLDEMAARENMSCPMAEFLRDMVVKRRNAFVCGGTSSGKTTLLNALSEEIPKDERVITIEDSAELKMNKSLNLVRLEAKSANYDLGKEISISDLIKTSLRMRPDRIIVGEVRGVESYDMLQAMNTGHDGSLSTGHANSNEDMLYRLETMIMSAKSMSIESIRRQIVSGIDYMINIRKCRDGKRRIVSIQYLSEFSSDKYCLIDIFGVREDDNGEFEFVDFRV